MAIPLAIPTEKARFEGSRKSVLEGFGNEVSGIPFGLGVPPLLHDFGLAHQVILLATVLTQMSSLLGDSP